MHLDQPLDCVEHRPTLLAEQVQLEQGSMFVLERYS